MGRTLVFLLFFGANLFGQAAAGNEKFDQKQYADAVNAYRAAILLRPNFAQARLNLGLTYAAAGNRRAAMEEYNQLRQIDPARAEKLLRVIQGR